MSDTLVGWLLALAIVAALIPLSAQGRRSSAAGCWSLLLLYVVAFAASDGLLPEVWRPLAPALAALSVWLAVQPLRALGSLTPAAIGLVPPRPGSVRPAIAATVAVLALSGLVIAARGVDPAVVTTAILAGAIIAAIVEELVMRGVLLALADDAIAPRWSVAGARIGPGGLIVTCAFIALHGARPGVLLGIAPPALLYLWLRARTGSLIAPIVAHVLWNLSVIALHR